MRAAATSRLNTQAKNLAQQRFESMRDLQYHVDHQNGPYVDLLDIYYTNVSGATTTVNRVTEQEVGHYVASAAAPAPAGPFYQVQVAAVPGPTGFSQTIDTQFLNANGVALAASTFTGYDSQTEGRDQPPALMVGVTVITTWKDHGVSHSLRSYTRIADSRGLTATLTSQGVAEYLRTSSTGPTGNVLTVDLASAEASGSSSTGSSAAADVHAFQAQDSGGLGYLGMWAVATSPNASAPPGTPPGPINTATNGNCGWVGVGPTQVSNVTADVLAAPGGLPRVPTNVDTASPPVNQATAQVTSNGSTQCKSFTFSNQSSGYAPSLMLDPDLPLVRIPDPGGNGTVVSGSAWVNATPATTTTHSVTSGANVASTQTLKLFMGATFMRQQSNYDGLGLVDIQLTRASIACSSTKSSGAVTQTSTGSWNVTIDYWKSTDNSGHGTRVTLPTYTWNSATDTGSADPLAALNPAGIVVYQNGTTTLHLSDFIASWSTNRKITENPNSGVHQLTGIVSIATQPVRDGDLLSSLGL